MNQGQELLQQGMGAAGDMMGQVPGMVDQGMSGIQSMLEEAYRKGVEAGAGMAQGMMGGGQPQQRAPNTPPPAGMFDL